jgi:hypothetical protein
MLLEEMGLNRSSSSFPLLLHDPLSHPFCHRLASLSTWRPRSSPALGSGLRAHLRTGQSPFEGRPDLTVRARRRRGARASHLSFSLCGQPTGRQRDHWWTLRSFLRL